MSDYLDVNGSFLTGNPSAADLAGTLIHELGHAADFLFGDNASKIIYDKTSKEAKQNDRTLRECEKFLKSLSNTK